MRASSSPRKVDRRLMLAVASPARRAASIEIGPLSIHAYGLMIALGVIAAVWLVGRRLEQAGARTTRGHARRSRSGRCSPGSSARGCTTWSPTSRESVARPGQGAADLAGRPRHPRGAARSASPAGCGWPSAAACRCSTVADAAAPALPLAQAIGGWATGGTRSCSAGRPTLPWGLRDRPDEHLAQNGVTTRPARRSTRRSSTSRCGTWRCACVLIWIGRPVKLRPGRLMVDVRARLLARPVLDRGPAHRQGQRRRRAAPQPVGGARRDPASCDRRSWSSTGLATATSPSRSKWTDGGVRCRG